jgi:hypothetical protein
LAVLVSLAVLTLLSQEPPPPSAPPLLPAPGDFEPRAPLAPQQSAPPSPRYAEPADLVPTQAEARAMEEKPSAAARIGGSIGAGAIGAAITTGGMAFVGSNGCLGGCASGSSNAFLLGTVFTAAGLALVSLGAWGAHRLLGGRSSVGWALLGGITGALLGGIAMLAIDTTTGNGTTRVPLWGYSVLASGLSAVGAGLMPELGNFLVVRQEQSVANPVRF